MFRVAATLVVLVLAGHAAAGEKPAGTAPNGEALRAEGMRDYDAGRYDAAVGKLRAAYALTHERAILYALGQAQRHTGDCRGAIETFETFVAQAPPPAAIGAARFQIARCLDELAASAPPPGTALPRPLPGTAPAPPGADRPRSPSTSDRAAPAAPRRWYRDRAGDALVGSGVAVAAAAAALFGVAESRAEHAGDDLQSFRDARDVGALRTAGIVVSAAGVALVIAGAARWIAVARHRPGSDRVRASASR